MLRKFCGAIIFSLIFFGIPQSILADNVVPSDRVTRYLRVRAGTSRNSETIGKLSRGESAEYIRSVPHWHYVRLNNGTEGYVHKSWTRLIPSATITQPLEVHFIDVGQGDSTLVVCPDGENILIDAGSVPKTSPDLIRDYILNIIDRHQRKIDTLIITHPHTDHYNILPDVLRGVEVGQVYYVGGEDDYNSTLWSWLEALANREALQADYFNPQNTPNPAMACGNAEVYILAASVQSSFSRKNTMSIVLMIRYGDFAVVLTGDATKHTENKIMERYPHDWLDSDILKIGHHGSLSTSTTTQWAGVIRPKTAVVSAGVRNSHGHPRREIVERLDDYTDNNVSPHLMISATGVRGNFNLSSLSRPKISEVKV